MRWLPTSFESDDLVSTSVGNPIEVEFDNTELLAWAAGGAYEFLAAAYDSDGCILTADVRWPDGSTGTYTRTVKSASCNMPDAYTITHDESGATVTQATMTRDGFCNVTVKPALTISGYVVITPAAAAFEQGTIVDFSTVAQVQASIITAQFVSLAADDSGTPGIFVRDSSSTATHDGTNVLVDGAGTRYIRRTHT